MSPSVGARVSGLAVAVAAGAGLFAAALPVLLPQTGALVRLAFAPLCHQRPDRSFALDGHAMAICHRCSGIYLGLAVGGVLALMGTRVPLGDRRTWLVAAGPLLLQAVPCTLFAGVRPYLDFVWLRVATGLLFGTIGGVALACAFGAVGFSARASRGRRS